MNPGHCFHGRLHKVSSQLAWLLGTVASLKLRYWFLWVQKLLLAHAYKHAIIFLGKKEEEAEDKQTQL
jgi:hypothetical protein